MTLTSEAAAPMPDADPACVVFVVDDDDAVAEALARLIRSAGYDTETFSSARAFLDHFPNCPRGCLVLDINMPEMSGRSLLRELRSRGWTLPVIYITGHAFPGGRRAAQAEGARELFLKPVEADRFLAELEGALRDGA